MFRRHFICLKAICFCILSVRNICLVAFPLPTTNAFLESSSELPTLCHHKQFPFHSKEEPVQKSHELKSCKTFLKKEASFFKEFISLY